MSVEHSALGGGEIFRVKRDFGFRVGRIQVQVMESRRRKRRVLRRAGLRERGEKHEEKDGRFHGNRNRISTRVGRPGDFDRSRSSSLKRVRQAFWRRAGLPTGFSWRVDKLAGSRLADMTVRPHMPALEE